MKFVLKYFLFVFVLVSLTCYTVSPLFAQQAANTATFTLSPASGSFSDTFSIDVKVTTGPATKVSTLRADVIYPPDKLEVLSIDITGSFIDPASGQWLNRDYTTPGTIMLSGSLSNAATTNGQASQFAKILFKVKAAGTATLSFGNSSAIYLYQPGATTPTNIYAPQSGGTYTLTLGSGTTVTTTTTPTPTRSSGNLPNAGNETPTMILISIGVLFTLIGTKKLLFSSL